MIRPMPKKLAIPALVVIGASSCVNHAVLERRASAWEEEAGVLESRGDARGAAALRELASKARGGPPPAPEKAKTPPQSRLGHQVENGSDRALSLYRDSRLEEALLILVEVLEKDPAHKAALDLRSRIESEKFTPKRDRPFADMAAELYEKGMKLLRRGDTRDAFDLLSQARQVYREDAVLERAYVRCGAELEAVDNSLKANDLFRRGRDLLDAGQPRDADELFAQAQALDASLPRIEEYRKQAEEGAKRAKLEALSARLASAREKISKGRYDGAENDLLGLMAMDPENAEALALRAEINTRREKDAQKAAEGEAFSSALKRSKDALSRRYAPAARKALDEAKELRPAWDFDEMDKKISRLEESRDPLVKEGADEAYRKGMIAYRQGRPDEAAGFFREALRLDGSHSKAAKALDRLVGAEVQP